VIGLWLVVYRALLWCAPARFRHRYADDALVLAEMRIREVSGVARLRVAARELADLLRIIVRERRSAPALGGGASLWRILAADLVSATRQLRFQRLQALLIVGVTAIGVGASATMFAVVDTVLLRPLPYPHGASLVHVTEFEPIRNLTGASFPALAEWSAFPSLARVGAYTDQHLLFNFGGEPERSSGAIVSPTFFDVLGVQPLTGRLMQPGDPLLMSDRQIVLGHALWQRQFNGDPAAIGRVITLEGKPYTVVAIAPAGFAFPADAQFWTSTSADMRMVQDERSLRFVDVIGRLAPGADLPQLQKELEAWHAATAPGLAAKDRWQVRAGMLRDEIVQSVRPALRIAMAGAGFLLIAALANITALMLARGRARAQHMAVEVALGAGRARLVRQRVGEAALLALAGGAVALVLVAIPRPAIVALSVDQIPRITALAVDIRVILVALALALGVTCLAAFGPAMAQTRRASNAFVSHAPTRVTGTRAGRRILGALVAAECAAAVTLLAGALLLGQTYLRLQAVSTGVSPRDVGVVNMNVPLSREWRQPDRLEAFVRDLRTELLAMPGMTHVAFTGRLPLDTSRGGVDVKADGAPESVLTLSTVVSDGYLPTVGARLLAGRDLDPGDTGGSVPVAVINDVLARRLFGDAQTAIGRTVSFQYMRGPVTLQVVGVVDAIRYDGLRGELKAELYQHYQQAILPPGVLVYRGVGTPPSYVPQMRGILAKLDPSRSVTLEGYTSLEQRLDRAFAQPRFFLVLAAAFALAALSLASLGLYGTLSHWIAERRRELGIRVALGANAAAILRLVMRRGLWLAGSGAMIGVVTSLVSAQMLSGLLFGVSPSDPRPLLGAALGLVVLSAMTCLAPARRATQIDPLETLRQGDL
jgi:predicted permease